MQIKHQGGTASISVPPAEAANSANPVTGVSHPIKNSNLRTGDEPAATGCSGCTLKLQHVDFWKTPVTVEKTNFQHKSLSAFIVNPAVGCAHGCRFCYVPEVSTIKLSETQRGYGVQDPDAEWGQYVFVRPWDEKKFLSSLKKADQTPAAKLNRDGHRAILFSSTTDPFQTIAQPGNSPEAKKLHDALEANVVRALELILENSSLPVRILTRSPLAVKHFALMKRFGDRLLFGMSLPSLNHRWTDIYEPGAPHPRKRLETLQKAKAAGLNVYVAVAPTYPECGDDDLRQTLTAIKGLDPVTVFHEPINIRGENVERIRVHAEANGVALDTEVYGDRNKWRNYAINQLIAMQKVAREVGLENCLHLWPDPALGAQGPFIEARQAAYLAEHPDALESQADRQRRSEEDVRAFLRFRGWLDAVWKRISEWPGEEVA